MRVMLLDEEKITKLTLPEEVDGVFIMNYKPVDSNIKKDLTIEAFDNKWFIKSNGSIDAIYNGEIVSKIELQENMHLKVSLNNMEELLDLYCLPTIDQTCQKIQIGINQFMIGRSTENGIIYDNEDVKLTHAGIYNQDGYWYIAIPENISDCKVYLNDYIVKTRNILHTGDIIFIHGLKIIWMGNFFQINNPNNKVSINEAILFRYEEVTYDNTKYEEVNEEQQNYELYKPEDYFFHTPNMREYVKEENIVIDPPPAKVYENNDNFLTTFGASFTMMASSFVAIINVINNIINHGKIISIITSLIMAISLLLGCLVVPKLAEKLQKRNLRRKELLRVTKYTAYIKSKDEKINLIMSKQAQILNSSNIDINTCVNAINSGTKNIWKREIKDEDFLVLRMGIGNVDPQIKINAPEEHFSLEDDDLLQLIYDLKNKHRKLENVPVTFNFIKNRVSAIIDDISYGEEFVNSIILQLATLHSAQDLKIVFLLNNPNKEKWEFAKLLPHTFSDDKKTRYYTENYDEMKTISTHLETIIKERKEQIKVGENDDIVEDSKSYKKFDSYYIIITNDIMISKTLPVINEILTSSENLGFSLIIIEKNMNQLPKRCNSFIALSKDSGCVMEKDLNSQTIFSPEYNPNINMKEQARKLLNIPLLPEDIQSTLPNSISFLDIFNVSKIEQLNITNRWKSNDPTMSLATPIGVHTSGEIFSLDLHEKNAGPHGLIAGSTGSGKSEFIITYVLSMCINYHPDEVQFVLIDYKGGGLAGAFEKRDIGKAVPHIAGTITNLDSSAINRSLTSINSELKRRQRIFNESKAITGESTIDIYKYQKYYREGIIKEPISHLFIVSDEFAELKAQQPEFMDELVSTARIGRSLGVHLILATQKPSGVVNEQIWSNSKFKVCLKVANKGDSMEMLKRPEAASIKETGRFYLQIGYDEYFDIGQSAWAGAKYVPTDRLIKKYDDSINFINNTGTVIKNVSNYIKKDKTEELGDQLTNITKALIDWADKEDYKTKKLWLDNIPEHIYLANLKQKYNYKSEPFIINPIIGEYDDPEGQKQDILTLPLTKNGNTIIFAANGTGQENLLSTIIFSTAIEHSPEEINFYIIDLGSETLKIFNKMPHVGDICTIDDIEKINNLLVMLDEELDKRKELFSDYNGDYSYYIKKTGEKVPLITCIINNYDAFVESFGKMNELLGSFYRECSKYGINFIITCSSQTTIRQKTQEYFQNKLCLRMAKDEDYRNILGAKKGLIPNKYNGRGIIKLDEGCYEFQTAYIYKEDLISETIKSTSQTLANAYKYKIKRVPVLPDVVTLDLIESDLKNIEKVPIGFNINTKAISSYNFKKNKINLITANSFNDLEKFIYPLSQELAMINKSKVKVIDFNQNLDSLKIGGEIISTDLDSVINTLSNDLTNTNNNDKEIIILLISPSSAKNHLQPESYQKFTDILNNCNNYKNLNIIIIEEYSTTKNLELEQWYISNRDKSSGIWIGEGIGSQTAISFNNLSPDIRRIEYSDMAFANENDEIIMLRKVVDNEDGD